jgi:hypothetical protein
VLLSGLETVKSEWSLFKGQIYQTKLPQTLSAPIEQLFVGGTMMVEARWPNVGSPTKDFPLNMLDPSHWELQGNGSKYGAMIDDELAKFPFSWNDAQVTLNVAHQFFTWTRTVSNHTIGGNSFNYPKDLPGITSYASMKTWPKSNMFFLSGKLEALDSPGEWFWDKSSSTLYLWNPTGGKPSSTEYKIRDFGFEAKAAADASPTAAPPVTVLSTVSNVHLQGVDFIGCTFALSNCEGCSVTNVNLEYPTYRRDIPEVNPPGSTENVARTLVDGNGISIKNLTLKYSNNNGLAVHGSNINVTNVLVAYTDWLGTLTYAPMKVNGNQIRITRSTVAYFGNAGVVTSIPNTPPNDVQPSNKTPPVPMPMSGRHLDVSYCNIHHGGMVGLDTAGLYSGGWSTAGLYWHHNWIHHHREKCIRCDDQSENATIHHNVAYNCGMPVGTVRKSGHGLVMKGDGHRIYANTFFNSAKDELCLPSCIEKRKGFRKQYPLVVQNNRSQLFNTAADKVLGGGCECPGGTAAGGNWTDVQTNLTLAELKLTDVDGMDFRPAVGSPLIDAGAVIPPYTDGFVGKAPDVGAYEHGGTRWVAGCTLDDPLCTA